MCCFITVLFFFGPRLTFLVYWLFRPVLVNAIFNTWIWPLLGLIFLPWTTLMYVFVAPAGVVGFDWLWLGLAVLVDITAYSGGVHNRERIPGYR